MSVLHAVNSWVITPKLLLLVAFSSRNKVQLCLSIICYGCICMYLLLYFSQIANWSLILTYPSLSSTGSIWKCEYKVLTITVSNLSIVPVKILLTKAYSFLHLCFCKKRLLSYWFKCQSCLPLFGIPANSTPMYKNAFLLK